MNRDILKVLAKPKKRTSLALFLFLFLVFLVDPGLFQPRERSGPIGEGMHEVARIVDGDTIKVSIGGAEETVRLIGINSPESVDPRRPVECFGKEASQYLKSLLEGKSVSLESDPTQSDRDKYGRLLRYVSIQDGTLVNEKMVAEGYAYEYTYDVPYRFQSEFKAAERMAQEAGRGLWSEIACNGKK